MPNGSFQRLLNMISDKADPQDIQGVQPVVSPIDLAVGGIGAGLPTLTRVAPRVIGNEIGSVGVPLAGSSAIQSAIRQRALQNLINPDIAAFKESGTISPKILEANRVGNEAINAINRQEALGETPDLSKIEILKPKVTDETTAPVQEDTQKLSDDEITQKIEALKDVLNKRRVQ